MEKLPWFLIEVPVKGDFFMREYKGEPSLPNNSVSLAQQAVNIRFSVPSMVFVIQT